jgi:hypothetical protein
MPRPEYVGELLIRDTSIPPNNEYRNQAAPDATEMAS